mgnify:CR=1 FL=1
MSININYLKKNSSDFSSNLVLFSNEKFNISNLKKYLTSSEFSYINDLLKTYDLKKNLLKKIYLSLNWIIVNNEIYGL